MKDLAKAKVLIILTEGRLHEIRVDAPLRSAEQVTEMAVRIAQKLATYSKTSGDAGEKEGG